jgi:ectoine hydroxylase-related dioxygenase (phytanoyl-CoA dioxygenase family)
MNARSDQAPFDRARSSATAFLLEQDGFCVVRDLAAPPVHRAAAELDRHFDGTPFCTGDFYGERTKRFGRLLARSSSMGELVMNPVILAVAQQILGPHCDAIQLNVTQAIEIHPGALAQFPHRDQDMWHGADNRHEFLINVIWPLTPFTEHNGATLIWPGSHGGRDADRQAAPIASVSQPGDAIVFLGSTLHGAGANRSSTPRRAIVVGYSLGWLKPYENPWLAYPPAIARNFPRDLAELAGYRQHRPNLGNFEGQCPSVLLERDRPQRLGAIDALRPDQALALADFVTNQREGAATSLAGPASRP